MARRRFAACPCCGAARFHLFYHNPSPRRPRDWRDFFYGSRAFIGDILECAACGYRFVDLLPAGYEQFYAAQDVAVYARKRAFRLRYFRRLRDALRSRGRVRVPDGARILDIGCADGDWLSVWPGPARLFGVEPCPDFRRELAAKRVTLVDAPGLGTGAYDLITLLDFLEHVPDPLALLATLRPRLAPRGFLVVSVPDMDKRVARLLGPRYYLYCPMHFSYFGARSLVQLLGRAFPGCSVGLFASPGMEFDLRMLSDWLRLSLPRWVNVRCPFRYSASLVAVVESHASPAR